jgi:hypothetical protein
VTDSKERFYDVSKHYSVEIAVEVLRRENQRHRTAHFAVDLFGGHFRNKFPISPPFFCGKLPCEGVKAQ